MDDLSISTISSKSSEKSKKSFDRLDLGISKEKNGTPKFSGKGNVMKRMKLFQSAKKENPPIPLLLNKSTIDKVCSQISEVKSKGKIKISTTNHFKIHQSYNQILPQIVDWGNDRFIFIGTNKGMQISNLTYYDKSIELGQNWYTRSIKLKDSQVAAIGASFGSAIIYDVVVNSKISTISQNTSKCRKMKSLIWDKNILLRGSQSFIKGKDTLSKKGCEFTLPSHKKSIICTMSLQDKSLAVSYQSGNLSLYDLRMNKCSNSVQFKQQSTGFFVQWCPWRKGVLIGARNKHLFQMLSTDCSILEQEQIEDNITGMKLLPLSQDIVTSSEYFGISVWDKKLQKTHQLIGDGLPAAINCLGGQVSSNLVHATTTKNRAYTWILPFHNKVIKPSTLEKDSWTSIR